MVPHPRCHHTTHVSAPRLPLLLRIQLTPPVGLLLLLPLLLPLPLLPLLPER